MEKPKKKPMTWGEAARTVLAHSACPLTHKEILQGIQDRNLKEIKLTRPQALACINAMLHANSRSAKDIFHKVEGRSGCYQLNENRVDKKEQATNNDSGDSSCTSGSSESKDSEATAFVTTGSGALPPISSMLGELATQVTTTSSVTSSLACAISDSRLNSLIAPSPETMPLTSALSKKRTVKPHFQCEPGMASKKTRVTFKLDKEKKTRQERTSTRPTVKTKAEMKYMAGEEALTFIPPVLKPPKDPTHTVVKNSSASYFGKKQKKISGSSQIKRSKDGLIDLISPDSNLLKSKVRNIINQTTFDLLPPHYQYKLVKMLPLVDQEVGSNGELKPSSGAFNNEFFTSAFSSWRERLGEGEFTPEMTVKIQQEDEKFFSLDPWKTKHFEAVWGEKLLNPEKYVSPVDKSLQILETAQVEYEMEVGRLKEQEKEIEMENEDLSAPNKLEQNERGEEMTKNSTTTNKRSSVSRQQKTANAKTAKAAAQKRGRKEKQDGVKGGKGRLTKQAKVNKVVTECGDTLIIDVTSSDGIPQYNIDHLPVPSVQVVSSLPMNTSSSLTDTPTIEALLAAGAPKKTSIATEKPKASSKTTNRNKRVVKQLNPSKPKIPPIAKQTATFDCQCMLKSMVICTICGAFCHSECVNTMSVCTACQIS